MISKIQPINIKPNNIKNSLKNQSRTDISIKKKSSMASFDSISNANYPYFINSNMSKAIAFSGNYNPLINYKSTKAAILNPNYNQLDVSNDADIPISKYASNVVSELFRNDRKFFDRGFAGETDSFDKFGKIGYINYVYKNTQKDSCHNIIEYFENNNLRPIENKYIDFYNNNLQSLEKVAKGEQKYSALFLDKKVGDKNLVDFWLNDLGANEIPQNDEDKIDLLNNKLKEKFNEDGNADKLALKTIDAYFMDEINKQNKPVQMNSVSKGATVEEIENLKNKLSKITNGARDEQKEEFLKLIQNEAILKTCINKDSLEDILLLPLEKEGVYAKDLDKNTKKEYLLEIADDNNLRRESLETALSTIRKNWMGAKAEAEKVKLADTAMQEEDFSNFNHQLVKEIFAQNSNEDSAKIITDIKLFEKEATKAFMNMIPQEPFKNPDVTDLTLKENTNVILSLVSERINTVKDEKEVNEIYENMDVLADALFEKSFNDANKIWEKLVKTGLTQWKEEHLPNIIQTQQQGYFDVKNFLKSPVAKEVENLDIRTTFLDSETVTIEQKAFLVKKMEPEIINKQGFDLCKFLSGNVPGNPARQRIINNLIESEGIAEENFDFLKSEFINAIREQDPKNQIIDKTIQKETVLDLFLLQTPYANSLYSMTKSEKLEALNKYPDEELNILAQEVKEKYLTEKSKEAFEEESAKYDLAPRFDKIMKNVEIEIKGEKYTIFEIMNSEHNQLGKLIKASSDLNQEQMKKVITLLSQNNAQGKEMRAILGIMLDKIQALHPQYAQQCHETKTYLQKLVTLNNVGSLATSIGMSIGMANPWPFICNIVNIFTRAAN